MATNDKSNKNGQRTESGRKPSASRAKSGEKRSASAHTVSSREDQLKMELEEKKKRTLRRNIIGIVIIFIAIILGIFIYGSKDGFLAKLAPVFFGLIGVAAFILPVMLAAIGVSFFFIGTERIRKTIPICGSIALFAAVMIVHVFALEEHLGEGYFEYIKSSYSLGLMHIGGGALSAVFVRAFSALLGKIGTFILLIGILVVMFLLIFDFFGKPESKSSDKKHSGKETKDKPKKEKRRAAKTEDELDTPDFIEHSGKPLTAGDFKQPVTEVPEHDVKAPVKDTEITSEEMLRITKEPASKRIPLIRDILSKKNGTSDDLSLLPTEGRFRRETQRERDEGSDLIIGPGFDHRKPAAKKTAKTAGKATEAAKTAAAAADEPEIIPEPIFEPIEPDPEFEPDEYSFEEPTIEMNTESNAAEAEASTLCPDGEEAEPSCEYAADDLPPVQYDDGIIVEPDTGAVKAPAKNETKIQDGVQTELRVYQRPPLTCLRKPDPTASVASESPEEKAKILLETLNCFGISARIINISVGPVITRFELQPAQGTRVNKITSLNKDIALALAASAIRIEAPIPGKAAIGIEVPNQNTSTVLLREVLECREFRESKSPITFALGKDIAGKVITADLGKMPHLLIAGQTGSGKSVCINDIILSLAYKSSPKEVRMILIDPKVVELSMYAPMPHLFCPVVTDAKKAAGALHWAVKEMEQRYNKMAAFHTREIDSYNEHQQNEDERWPRLVIVIDELAELMLVASKDIEESICRIAQLGRACGIHLIVATQRPSVDVITGLIKANIPTRIAFAVSNATDSRVILDTGGAEQLIGNGDMLFHANGARKARRIQGAYVSESEVDNVMTFFADTKQQISSYDETVLTEIASSGNTLGQGNGKQEDELLPDAIRVIIESGAASTSMLQRRLRVGYARASRLMDIMEQKGYVSVPDGAKPRNVLITAAQYNETYGSDNPIIG